MTGIPPIVMVCRWCEHLASSHRARPSTARGCDCCDECDAEAAR